MRQQEKVTGRTGRNWGRHEDLQKKFDALQDFVSANVGVASPASTLSPVSSNNSSYAAAVLATNPPPKPHDSGFTTVRNGARPTQRTKEMLIPTTFNRFQVLGDSIEEDFETRLVGDSMIRGQLVEFCGRASNNKRKRFCFPGARLDDVTAACDDVTAGADNNTLYILHAGTNDVTSTRSEELLQKYRRMIQEFKHKTGNNNIIVSGILPKIDAESRFYDKAFSTNSRLNSLCLQEKVEFVNLWDDFYGKKSLFQTDCVHLNSVGAARLGRLLCNRVSLFKSKNSNLSPPAEST